MFCVKRRGGKNHLLRCLCEREQGFKLEQERSRPGIAKPLLMRWSELCRKVGRPLRGGVVGTTEQASWQRCTCGGFCVGVAALVENFAEYFFSRALFFCNSVVSVLTSLVGSALAAGWLDLLWRFVMEITFEPKMQL